MAGAPYRRLALRRSFSPQHGHPGSSLTIQTPHCWQRTWPASYLLPMPGLPAWCRMHVPRQAIMPYAPPCRVLQRKKMTSCSVRSPSPPSRDPPHCPYGRRSSQEPLPRSGPSPLHPCSDNGNFVFILYDKYIIRNGRQGYPARRDARCPFPPCIVGTPGAPYHNTSNNNHIC